MGRMAFVGTGRLASNCLGQGAFVGGELCRCRRVTGEDRGCLICASNTQDVLVARAKSDSQEKLDRLLA